MTFLLVTLILFVPVNDVMSHVEDGKMPDSVAEMEYRILLEFKPGDIETRYKLAMVLFRQKKIIESEKELKRILDVKPKYFNGLEGLGRVKIEQKEYDLAIKFFSTAITVDSEDAMVYYFLGIAQGKKGQFLEAEHSLSMALEKNLTSSSEKQSHFNSKQVEDALEKIRARIKAGKMENIKPEVTVE